MLSVVIQRRILIQVYSGESFRRHYIEPYGLRVNGSSWPVSRRRRGEHGNTGRQLLIGAHSKRRRVRPAGTRFSGSCPKRKGVFSIFIIPSTAHSTPRLPTWCFASAGESKRDRHLEGLSSHNKRLRDVVIGSWSTDVELFVYNLRALFPWLLQKYRKKCVFLLSTHFTKFGVKTH